MGETATMPKGSRKRGKPVEANPSRTAEVVVPEGVIHEPESVVELSVGFDLRPDKYAKRSVRIHNLTRAQAEGLRGLYDGIEGRARLSNGRCVQRPEDVIRYLLEQAREQM